MIYSGPDRNQNGLLDAGEIISTQSICSPIGSANTSLVSVIAEPVGSNCPNAGKKISAGLDRNANGVLDSAEVSTSAYVCNGLNGAPGTPGPAGVAGVNGFSSLVKVAAESAGINCTYGGSRIASGLDGNVNGVLDVAEITSTTYTCNGAPGSAMSWVTATAATVQGSSNSGYVADAATPVSVVLPASPNLGDRIAVTGAGAGGWKIAQNDGQQILMAERNLTWIAADTSTLSTNLWPMQRRVAMSGDGTLMFSATGSSSGSSLMRSRDGGRTWTSVAIAAAQTVSVSRDGMTVVVGASVGNVGTVFLSTDRGTTWSSRSVFVDEGYGHQITASAVSSDGNRIVIGTNTDLFVSTDAGLNWTSAARGRDHSGLSMSGSGDFLVSSGSSGDLALSTDLGSTWTSIRSGFGTVVSSAVSDDGRHIAAASYSGGVQISDDAGLSWQSLGLNYLVEVRMSADGRVMAISSDQGLFVSLNGGQAWTLQTVHPLSYDNNGIVAVSADGSTLVKIAYFSPPWIARTASTVGVAGNVSGSRYEAIELQYVGAGAFIVTGQTGLPVAH